MTANPACIDDLPGWRAFYSAFINEHDEQALRLETALGLANALAMLARATAPASGETDQSRALITLADSLESIARASRDQHIQTWDMCRSHFTATGEAP